MDQRFNPSPPGCVWYFEDGPRREIWTQTGTDFSPAKVLLDEREGNKDLLEGKQCRHCQASRFYPSQFVYCPSCGQRIEPFLKDAPNWTPPYGSPRQSRTLPSLSWCAVEGTNSRPFGLPEDGGRFVFVVTSRGTRLYALDREHGQVFVYSVLTCGWYRLGDIPAISLPAWSWTGALVSPGIVIPTKVGGCLVTLPTQSTTEEIACLRASSETTALGGATVHGHNAILPVRGPDGVYLQWVDVQAERPEWQLQPVDGAQPAIGPEESFGAAVLNGRGDTFWPAQNGYLALRRRNGRLSARWRAWSRGYEGCPRYLGYQDTQNAAWQLCKGCEGYAYGKMSFDGNADIQQVDGPHLSVGPRTFRKNSCYQTPWDSNSCQDWFPAGKFIQPLLGLQNGSLYLAMEDVSYEDYIHRAGSYSADLRFRKNAGGDLVLEKNRGLCSPWDVQIFLYQGDLHFYLESQNRCWSWQGHHDQA